MPIFKKDKGLLFSSDLIVDLAPDIIAVVDNDKKYISLNRAGLEFFGKKAIGREADDFFVGKQETYHKVEPVFSGKEGVCYVESWQKRSDGESRLLAWWCRSLKDEKGNPQGALSIASDITEKYELEKKLLLRESQLDNAMRLAHLGPWEYDYLNDKFIFNDAFYAIFGTTVEKEGGYIMSSAQYSKRFVHPEDAPLVGKEVEKSIITTDPNFTRQLEHRVIFADGRAGYISVRFFIEKDDTGRTIRSFGINQDITDIKEKEAELEKFGNDLKLRIEELERFKKVVVDCELKMIELKNRIKDLESELGK